MATTPRTQVHTPQDDRSLGTLISELAQDTTTLVQQEVALAKAEMSEKASKWVRAYRHLPSEASSCWLAFWR